MKALATAVSGCVLVGLAGGTALAAPVPPPDVAEARLRALNSRFIEAFVADDAGFVATVTGDDFVYTGRDGEWLLRGDVLERMRQPRPLGTPAIEDVRVRLFGPAAVVHAAFAVVTEGGAPVRIRYTDVYAWDGEDWRLVNAQHTALGDDVVVQLRTATSPVYPRWAGRDPTGDDASVLKTLNEQYVAAFRNADVAWYDAHLAPGYVVVYGDGSFHDRAAALADFAQPYFATHLDSFPVGRVSVRRYGDLAVIQAENDYRRKDGRRGVNRYTDLWLLREGRWQCIAAHITVHKPPT